MSYEPAAVLVSDVLGIRQPSGSSRRTRTDASVAQMASVASQARAAALLPTCGPSKPGAGGYLWPDGAWAVCWGLPVESCGEGRGAEMKA